MRFAAVLSRAVVFVAVQAVSAIAATDAVIHGFGADTPGGQGAEVVRVTTLADSGAGSLREALAAGNRHVVFDVAGTIELSSGLNVREAYVTIDGFSAPPPGITLRNRGLSIKGTAAHDVIVRGIRVHQAFDDGISVGSGAHHVLIHHVSVDGSGDGNIDVTYGAHDVTIAWSVLSRCSKNMLIKYGAYRVSLHHNVFTQAQWRNPWVANWNEGELADDTTVDARNNLIYEWGTGGGTGVDCGAKVNLFGNFYSSPASTAANQERALVQSGCGTGSRGLVYMSGNHSADPIARPLDSRGNAGEPFAAPSMTTTSACIGAADALAGAGAPPLDDVDLTNLALITLSPCDATSTGPTPTSVASTATPTATPTPTETATPEPSATVEPTPTPDATTTPEPTATVEPTATPAATATPEPTATVDPTAPPIPTATPQPVIEPDPTATPEPTLTSTPTATATPEPTFTPTPPATPTAASEQRVLLKLSPGTNDADQTSTASKANLTNKTLLLGSGRTLFYRFVGVSVPPGARIVSAKLRTYVLGRGSEPVSLRFSGDRAASSPAFSGNLRARPTTSAVVDAAPPAWRVSAYNDSPDLAAIVQEIVDLPGWASGNALSLFAFDRGSPSYRKLASYETASGQAAILDVVWVTR